VSPIGRLSSAVSTTSRVRGEVVEGERRRPEIEEVGAVLEVDGEWRR
jgi:hypothetical protein